MDKQGHMDPEVITSLFEHGLFAIQVPEQYGGLGETLFRSVLAIEEVASFDPSLSVMIDVHNTLILRCLERWASDEQKSEWFPKLAKDTVGAFCLSEPESGSDAFALRTRAEKTDSGWLLNGSKMWITNAAEAGLFVVFANVSPEDGYRGISTFLVPRDTEGLVIGEREQKVGLKASSTCPVTFENCEVPDNALLGEKGLGYRYAIELLNEGRIGIGAQVLGLARGAFDLAFNYLHEREQFGQRIGDFQGVQFQYADLATELEAARLMVYNATRLAESGEDFAREAAMAKLYASETAQKVVSSSLEFFGGLGFSEENLIGKFYRDVKVGTIYEGTSNMQRLTIAKQLQSAAGFDR
jgi:alkylation response protein AidB-like acyl-CoA dehydrogenase